MACPAGLLWRVRSRRPWRRRGRRSSRHDGGRAVRDGDGSPTTQLAARVHARVDRSAPSCSVTRNELRPQLLAEPLFAALVWAARRRRTAVVAACCSWAAPIALVLWADVTAPSCWGVASCCSGSPSTSSTSTRPCVAPSAVGRAAWLALRRGARPRSPAPTGCTSRATTTPCSATTRFADYISEWWPSDAHECATRLLSRSWPSSAWSLWQEACQNSAFDGWLSCWQPPLPRWRAQHNIVWFALAVMALHAARHRPDIASRLHVPSDCPGSAVLCLCGALVGAFTLTRVATGGDASLMKAYPRSAAPIAAAAARKTRTPKCYTSPWLSDWLLFTNIRHSPVASSADGRYELLTSARVRALRGNARCASARSAATYPEARILALNDSPKLAARTRRQPGARVMAARRPGDDRDHAACACVAMWEQAALMPRVPPSGSRRRRRRGTRRRR